MAGSPVQAAGVIVFKDGAPRQFLLMRHPTRWDLPKGHVDPGETLIDCALREMHEETGILPEQVDIAPDFRFETQYNVTYKETGDQVFLKTVTLFLAWLQADVVIVPTEHEGYQWFDWQPPHQFDNPTIDPLLAQLAAHWADDR